MFEKVHGEEQYENGNEKRVAILKCNGI